MIATIIRQLALLSVLTLQPEDGLPIRVSNPQVDPLDRSVRYEFVNEDGDVTAYEIAITRHFADGSSLVSTQGQDWFVTSGYGAVRTATYSLYSSWSPKYSATEPGINLHRLDTPVPNVPLIYADVELKAVIRLDGTAFGDAETIERFFRQRAAMFTEYSYWVPRLERATEFDEPMEGFDWLVRGLSKPRRDEVIAPPREALLQAATVWQRWSREHPLDAPKLLAAIVKVATQQRELLGEQSTWRRY